MITKLLDSLYPKRCVGCGVEGLSWICHDCAVVSSEYPKQVEPGVWALSSFNEPVIREALHGLKYHSLHGLAEELINMLWRANLILPSAQLIPVPTSFKTLKRRGYNQAELFAEAISRRTGQEINTRLLKKTRSTSLVGLGKTERLSARGFARTNGALPEKPLVLIDDIRTTGSTVSQCLSLLGPTATALVIAQD